ncbi:peroxidase 1-like [Panicum miliaceum]|uniref:Peroxidase n=1 Tax=Panicum miliaceum TaxID=4540 RepID=A0A3L6R513_PANMI|nr:peroxidase 1-like [Panicum miliaceum]
MKQACLQLLMVAFQATLVTMSSSAGLQYDFYSSSCPNAEQTVRNVVNGMIDADQTMPAAFLRLLFHDCFVMGCDASILLDPTKANEAVNKIKAAVEDVCSGKVSCADILAFAARDSVARSGGFTFPIPSGRRDGTVSSAFSQLIDSFAAKNLSVDDLVALSGAHSIGVSHCSAFANRLRPTVDPAYAAQLNATCPAGGADRAVNNSPVAPDALSNQYYRNALAGRVLLTSDAALLTRGDTAARVNATAWMARFAAAMVRMAGVEVLTGAQGEVRRLCNVTNS